MKLRRRSSSTSQQIFGKKLKICQSKKQNKTEITGQKNDEKIYCNIIYTVRAMRISAGRRIYT